MFVYAITSVPYLSIRYGGTGIVFLHNLRVRLNKEVPLRGHCFIRYPAIDAKKEDRPADTMAYRFSVLIRNAVLRRPVVPGVCYRKHTFLQPTVPQQSRNQTLSFTAQRENRMHRMIAATCHADRRASVSCRNSFFRDGIAMYHHWYRILTLLLRRAAESFLQRIIRYRSDNGPARGHKAYQIFRDRMTSVSHLKRFLHSFDETHGSADNPDETKYLCIPNSSRPKRLSLYPRAYHKYKAIREQFEQRTYIRKQSKLGNHSVLSCILREIIRTDRKTEQTRSLKEWIAASTESASAISLHPRKTRIFGTKQALQPLIPPSRRNPPRVMNQPPEMPAGHAA